MRVDEEDGSGRGGGVGGWWGGVYYFVTITDITDSTIKDYANKRH